MNIIFHHPPTKTKNPLVDFDPSNPKHYPGEKEEGVYIYGIRARVAGTLKFIPLVVGEGGDLFKRLYKDHYLGKFANPLAILLGNNTLKSGDPKEIWDFSNTNLSTSDLNDIYCDIKSYNNQIGKRGKVSLVADLNHLLFFQNCDYFHLRYGGKQLAKKKDIGTHEAVGYLMDMLNNGYAHHSHKIQQHAVRIILSLSNFKDRYYYVYAPTSSIKDKGLTKRETRESIEKRTKDLLNTINIYTTADSRKGASIQCPVNLSNIADELVNNGVHNYNNKNGYYNKPLILI